MKYELNAINATNITTKTARYAGQEFRTVYFSITAINAIRKEFSDILHHPDALFVLELITTKIKK